MPPDPLSPGSSLQEGRFIIVGVIARGGQAVTFEAVDKRQGNRVAIKRFQVSGATSWKDVELAEREARVLAALDHPSLPRYVEHFEEAGSLYLVMDYVAGPTLEELRSSNALRHNDVVHFLREMAVALDYLHHHSPPIIHRDIKPRNVIRRPDGHFTLVDFGSVRDKLRPEGGSTVVGTFGYMAPEQFQGRAMPATDVYATAATALAMLTGLEPDQLPHQGLRIDVNAALNESVSPRLKRLLHQALDPDPDLRGAQSLTQLLKSHRLLSENEPNMDSSYRHAGAAHGRRAAARPKAKPQHQADVAPGGPPFSTHGHRRNRSRQRRADETTVPNLEASFAQALEHHGVRAALRMPFVMTLVILVLLLVRTSLWLVLGVALPTLFSVLQAILRLPLADAAGESMATARALRAQFRRISKQLRAVRRGTYVTPTPSTPTTAEHTRYRVHTRPDSEVAPKSQSKPEQFADELEQDAEKFESELERNVLSWQGRLSDRK